MNQPLDGALDATLCQPDQVQTRADFGGQLQVLSARRASVLVTEHHLAGQVQHFDFHRSCLMRIPLNGEFSMDGWVGVDHWGFQIAFWRIDTCDHAWITRKCSDCESALDAIKPTQ